MAKMIKTYEQTFKKGEHDDDQLYQIMRELTRISSKPLKENGEVNEFSYSTILHKKVKMILYVED
jgi:hypothetical protein